MRKFTKIALIAASAMLAACSESSGGLTSANSSKKEEANATHKAIDYSAGRAMNQRLGKGINLGNAWESACYWRTEVPNIPDDPYNFGGIDYLDDCWSNPIKDEYFDIVKAAGFNSVRIPVRWQHNSNPVTHEVSPERLAGVMEDVQLAVNAGLAVIISFHWYYEMMNAANNADVNPEGYQNELLHFTSIWTQVATAFKKFPDDMLVWDIMNEPTIKSADRLNEVMLAGYNAIRQADPNKTIMFESYHAAKFADLEALNLPEDGNIIYSGHYYEPYGFTHQGHSYACNGDAAYSMTASADLKSYVALAKKLYPDVNGGFIPMNMGEFGVSGGPGANSSSCYDDQGNPKGEPPSAAKKALWAKNAILAAEAYGLSWTYWGFVGVGGFEAYDKGSGTWNEGFPDAFGLK